MSLCVPSELRVDIKEEANRLVWRGFTVGNRTPCPHMGLIWRTQYLHFIIQLCVVIFISQIWIFLKEILNQATDKDVKSGQSALSISLCDSSCKKSCILKPEKVPVHLRNCCFLGFVTLNDMFTRPTLVLIWLLTTIKPLSLYNCNMLKEKSPIVISHGLLVSFLTFHSHSLTSYLCFYFSLSLISLFQTPFHLSLHSLCTCDCLLFSVTLTWSLPFPEALHTVALSEPQSCGLCAGQHS